MRATADYFPVLVIVRAIVAPSPLFTTIRPITLLKLASRQLRSVTIPLHAYDRSSNSVFVIFPFRLSRVLGKTFWNFAGIVMKRDFRDHVARDCPVFQHRSVAQLKYQGSIYLANSFISNGKFQVTVDFPE